MNRRVASLGALSLIAGLLFVASPSRAGGFCADGRFTDERTTEISMAAMCFAPTVARVDKGASVTFANDDSTLHAVGGINNVFGELHTEVARGKSVSYTFKEEGVFPYVCILHPGMGGAIVVGDGEGPASTAAIPANPTIEEPAERTTADVGETPADKSFVWFGAVLAILGLGLAFLGVRRRVAGLQP